MVYRGKIYVGNERITLQRSDIISFDHNSFHIVYLRKGSTFWRTCPKLHVITQAVLIKACGFDDNGSDDGGYGGMDYGGLDPPEYCQRLSPPLTPSQPHAATITTASLAAPPELPMVHTSLTSDGVRYAAHHLNSIDQDYLALLRSGLTGTWITFWYADLQTLTVSLISKSSLNRVAFAFKTRPDPMKRITLRSGICPNCNMVCHEKVYSLGACLLCITHC